MAALRAKLSVELLPIDEECLLKRAAGALATYSAFVARERAKIDGFASVLQAASWLRSGPSSFAALRRELAASQLLRVASVQQKTISVVQHQ